MAGRQTDRRDDLLHLAWVALRVEGFSSGTIAEYYGTTSSRVRTVTNRIRDDYADSTGGDDRITFP